MEFYQVYEKTYHQHGIQFWRLFLWKNLSAEEFGHGFQRLSSWLSSSLHLHIPSNLEIILRNWQLASFRKMKHLESNLVCVDVVTLPVEKQHDIAYEISEKI